MNDVLAVLAVIAVVAYVIVRQLKGEPIRGKRLIVLPAVLVLIGIMDLTSARPHPASAPCRRSQDDQGRNPQRTGRHSAGSSRMPRPSTAADSATSARCAATGTAAGGAGDLARPAGGSRGSGHGRGARISARAPWRSRHRQEPE
jgi:hypothetical protein